MLILNSEELPEDSFEIGLSETKLKMALGEMETLSINEEIEIKVGSCSR